MVTQVADNLHVSGNKDHSHLCYLGKFDFGLGIWLYNPFSLKGMKIAFLAAVSEDVSSVFSSLVFDMFVMLLQVNLFFLDVSGFFLLLSFVWGFFIFFPPRLHPSHNLHLYLSFNKSSLKNVIINQNFSHLCHS